MQGGFRLPERVGRLCLGGGLGSGEYFVGLWCSRVHLWYSAWAKELEFEGFLVWTSYGSLGKSRFWAFLGS